MGAKIPDLDDTSAVAHVLRIYVVVDRRVDPVFYKFMLIPFTVTQAERETIEANWSESQRGQFVYAWSAVDERGWARSVADLTRLSTFYTETPSWVVDQVKSESPDASSPDRPNTGH